METLQEKIISLELTKPTDLNLKMPLNGDNEEKIDEEDETETVSEPATPTTNDEVGLDENSQANIKKKKRKRSKRGKQQQQQH